MKKILLLLTLALILLILALSFAACGSGDDKDHASPTTESVSLPYKDLSADEILSATVSIPPSGFQAVLSDEETEKLVAILRTIEIGSPDYSVEIEGEQTVFTLKMNTGAEKSIYTYNNVIYISDAFTVKPYETEIIHTLSEFGKRIAEGAYQQFSEKITDSVYASSGSITNVTTGQVVLVRLDENQSLPGRWNPVISDNSMIALIHDEIDLSKAISNDTPGAGGEKHIFYFEALRMGECTIDMNLVFGDDEIAETESYTIRIED